jgi:hypothetical protein
LFHVHIGGSSCWMKPNNHCIIFHPITEELLPPLAERDPSTWWIIREPAGVESPHLRVYCIHIAPEDQVPQSFPGLF